MIKSNYTLSEKQALSTFWAQGYKQGSHRLSLFGKGITFIDKLYTIPEQILNQIKQINLSHNALTRLDNIKQFPNIQVLNISHNYLTDGKTLKKLKCLNRLHTIYLKGNPFLTSQQGQQQAFSFIVTRTTDIPLLTLPCQNNIKQMIKIWKKIQLNKNLENRLLMHVQYRKQYESVVNQDILASLNDEKHHHDKQNRNIHKNMIQKIFDEKVLEQQNSENFIRMQILQKIIQKYNIPQNLNNLEKSVNNQLQQMQNQLINIEETIKSNENLLKNTLQSAQKRQKSKQKYRSLITPRDINSPTKNAHKLRQKWSTPIKQNIDKDQPKYIQYQQKIKKNQQNKKKQEPFQQKFETYYSNMLRKYSPVYHLLYCPLQSLKNNQKDLLIQTLSGHLREKSFSVFRNEKMKGQLANIHNKLEQKQSQFMELQNQFKKYKLLMQEAKLSVQNTLQQQRYNYHKIQKQLSQKNTQLKQKIQIISQLTDQLSQQKLVKIRQNSLIQKYQLYEQYQEKLTNMKQARIKKVYISLLNKKSNKVSQLKVFKQKFQNNKHKTLRREIFNQWKYQYWLQSLSKYFRENRQKQMKIKFIQTLSVLTKTQSKRKKIINTKQCKQMKQFINISQQTLTHKNRQKTLIRVIQRTSQINIYRKIFNFWQKQAQQQLSETKIKQARKWHELKLQQKCLKQLKNAQQRVIYLQSELIVDRKTKIINKFLDNIQDNFFISKQINQKFINLIIFLNKNKRILNYTRLRINTLTDIQARKTKCKKIELQNKSKSLLQFCGICLYNLNLKKQRKYKQKLVTDCLKKRFLKNMKMAEFSYKVKNRCLKNLFDAARKKQISNLFLLKIKQFSVSDYHQKSKIKRFFTLLRQKQFQKRRIFIKLDKFRIKKQSSFKQKSIFYSITNRFFKELSKPISLKKKLGQALSKRYFRLMQKSFIEWKLESYRQQVSLWKKQLKNLGCQIDDIQSRHLNVYEEKKALIAVIENRQKQIKNLCHKLQEAQYLVNTKQQKYQQLKQMYITNKEQKFSFGTHQSINISGKFNYPAIEQINQSRIPQRDLDSLYQSERKDEKFLANFCKF